MFQCPQRRTRNERPTLDTGLGQSTLVIDGNPAGRIETRLGFFNFVS
jgi:hypothetical protein